MNFHQHSKQIVEEYLGTVAYVDDLIFSTRNEIKATVINNPDIRTASDESQLKGKIEQKVERNQQLVPNINPLVFTNAFLEKGIHCALLELVENKSNLVSIKKTLKKSDVIILDWQMHGDLGQSTCGLIEFILSEDRVTSLSLRLMIIYTDQPVYNSLIGDSIIPIFTKLGIQYIISDSGTEIISGFTKIIVLQKPKLGIFEDGKISGEVLPDKIIEELTLLTEGIVSNSILKAISVIRRNSHKLLGLFNRELDPAFLGHRLLSTFPSDSEEYFVNIISESLNSLLHNNNVSAELKLSSISKWLNAKLLPDITMKIFKEDTSINNNIRKDLLKNGMTTKSLTIKDILNRKFPNDNQETLERRLRDGSKEFHKEATKIFIDGDIDPIVYDSRFSIITHHKSDYKLVGYKPKLTLGTIIRGTISNKYWFCIQQKCDSLRIEDKEERRFLFIPMEIVDENKKFNFIIEELDGHFKRLKIDTSTPKLKTIKFKATFDGMVCARKYGKSGNYFFYSIYSQNKKEESFLWVMDVKDAHAQRIANEFASNLSRVGLDESEWLRRWSN